MATVQVQQYLEKVTGYADTYYNEITHVMDIKMDHAFNAIDDLCDPFIALMKEIEDQDKELHTLYATLKHEMGLLAEEVNTAGQQVIQEEAFLTKEILDMKEIAIDAARKGIHSTQSHRHKSRGHAGNREGAGIDAEAEPTEGKTSRKRNDFQLPPAELVTGKTGRGKGSQRNTSTHLSSSHHADEFNKAMRVL